jgi:hypothetical protein
MTKFLRIAQAALVMMFLICASSAWAQNTPATLQVTQDNQPAGDVSVFVLVGANKFSAGTPPTGVTNSSGTFVFPADLLSANKPHTQMVVYEVCVNGKKVIFIIPQGTEDQLPEDTGDCHKRYLGFFWLDGGGSIIVDLTRGTVTQSGGVGPSPPSAGAVSEGAPPVTFEATFAGGGITAGNLSTTSGIEGDVAIFFGPGIGVGGGFVRSGDTTGHQTVTGSTPGSSTQVPFTANFHAGEIKGIVKVVSVGPFSIAVQGGAWPFTARESTTTTIIVTTPTGGTSTEVVTQIKSQGGVAPEFGGDFQVALTKYLAVVVAVKRAYLRSGNSLNQGVTMFVGGVSVTPSRVRGLFHIRFK